jgi:hypothetical protein
VGYTKIERTAGSFTLVGLTFHRPAVASGVFTAKSGTFLTAAALNFTSLLTPGTYVLELPDGEVQEVTAWSGDTLTTPEDISSLIVLNETNFILRPAATIASVFGSSNSANLAPYIEGNKVGPDYILIRNSEGALLQYYYFKGDGSTDSENAGWYSRTDGERADNKAIIYNEGLFIQHASLDTPLSFIVSGEVKTNPTAGVLEAGKYSYLSGVAPAGLTLSNSGLSSQITQFIPTTTGEPNAYDRVLIPQPSGEYPEYYFYNDPKDPDTIGWYGKDGNRADNRALNGGFLILNSGVKKPFKISVPAWYSDLSPK